MSGQDQALEEGRRLLGDGRPDAAAPIFQAAAAQRPNNPEAWFGLGVALAMTGRLKEAAAAFETTTRLDPRNADAWGNLGKALQGAGEQAAGLAAFERAAGLARGSAQAQFNLATALARAGRRREALAAARQAATLRPDWPDAQVLLGHLLLEDGQVEAAAAAGQAAVRLVPGSAAAQNNLGVALFQLGRLEEAEAALTRAVALAPDAPRTHHSLAFLRLKQGRLADGFREYEWRWREPGADPPAPDGVPRWTGQPLAGRTLRIEPEQGVGDLIQFIRFARLAAERGARVVLRAPPGLAELLASAPGVALATSGALPTADFRCSPLSLPAWLGVEMKDLPGPVPYLQCPEDRVRLWAGRLPPGRIQVGVVWQGNPAARSERTRSFPLAALRPLADIPGVTLVSLQKGPGVEQLDAPDAPPITRLGAEYDAGDWLDTAAVVTSLDLVIACDTGVAHLAGALGRPAWLALAHVGEWRWLTERSDTPWYPTLRLFRQAAPGDWASVFAAMAAALKA